MTDIERVTPEEAQKLIARGYTYVDVRSEPEFEQGHVPGAYNVPLMHQGAAGMEPNAEFDAVMQAAFGKNEKLLLGCRSGGRSLRAATRLKALGFEDVVDLKTGWEGSRDAFGRLDPGWERAGLPVERGTPDERGYADVRKRAGV